jgi:hypothetical protein
MALGPTKLGRIWIKQQAAWGTAITSFADADSMDVQGTFMPAGFQEALSQPVVRPVFGASPKQGGSKAGGTIQMTWVQTNTTAAASHIEHQLIADALGTLQEQAGIGTIDGTSIATRLDVTTGDQDWIGQGALVGLTGGGSQIAWVKDVDNTPTPDEVTITSLLAVPNDAVSVLPTITIAFDANNTSGLPFTVQFAGKSNSGERLWDGRVSSLTGTFDAKGQITWQATLTFLNNVSVDSLTVAAFTFPRSQLGPNLNALSVDLGGSSAFCYAGLSLSVTQTLAESPCNSSDQGVSQLVTADRAVTLTERLLSEDVYADAYQAPGTTASFTWGLTSKTAATGYHAAIYGAGLQLASMSQPTDLGGLWGVERVWEAPATLNTGDTDDGASTVKLTRFRISFG